MPVHIDMKVVLSMGWWGWCVGSALNLYSRGVRFESWPNY